MRPQLKRDPLDGATLPSPLRRFVSAHKTWWRKPLVYHKRRVLPAELAVLALDLRRGERGVWMNSRGTSRGLVSLVPRGRAYTTRLEAIPEFVASILKDIYRTLKVKSGCPDLVIWHSRRKRLRFVEVKGPGDRIRDAQRRFIRIAGHHRIATKVAVWTFRDRAV